MKPNNLIKRNQLPAIIAASQTPTPRPPHLIRQRLRRCFCASWILLLLLTRPAVVQAQFTYVTNNGAITITGYTGLGGAVTIPAETNGLPVTSIGDYAFDACASLTGVTIPKSVITIGEGAFLACFNLERMDFQGNAPSLGADVFLGADSVTVYYLPGTIGWGATFAERPTALWLLPYPVILTTTPDFRIQTNGFGFIISWATNLSVVVETSINLANPSWSPLSTNTLTDGWSYFSDPQWTNHPARFYRIRSP